MAAGLTLTNTLLKPDVGLNHLSISHSRQVHDRILEEVLCQRKTVGSMERKSISYERALARNRRLEVAWSLLQLEGDSGSSSRTRTKKSTNMLRVGGFP